MTDLFDPTRISKLYGDRVLVKRLGNPERRGGLLIPASCRPKKEPKKVWWGEVVKIGDESIAGEEYKLEVGAVIGCEPLGNHYAGWKGADGNEYVWVPDEHLAVADAGSVALYYKDALPRDSSPALRLLGKRLLLRPFVEEDGAIKRVYSEDEREAKPADIVTLGQYDKKELKELGLAVGERILHVAAESGSSSVIDIFDPPLIVLREVDIIAKLAFPVAA